MEFLEKKYTPIAVLASLAVSVLIYFWQKNAGHLGIADLFFYLGLFFLVLGFLQMDIYISKKFNLGSEFGVFFVFGAVVVSGLFFFHLPGHDHGLGIPVSSHLAMMQAQNNSTSTRYTLSFIPPEESIIPNKDTTLKFRIYNADTGEQVTKFDSLYEKLVHLVIVGGELQFFSHIHPVLQNGEFIVTTKFPKNDLYHLYLNFQPGGGPEQQFGVTLAVGNQPAAASVQSADNNLTKTFGDYNVTLVKHEDFRAVDMTKGQQSIVFGLTYASSGIPALNLFPYLGSFGHLTLINQKTYQYIHVHPITPVTEGPSQHGGPSVEFVPLGLYGSIKPGVYRVFAEFNPGGKLLDTDFTIEVK
jgi:hypothetical protein